MYKSLLILALLVGLVNQFVLDDALTDWVSDNAKAYWYWGVWVLVGLIYVIGDKLLKTASSTGDDVLEKLNEINTNLEQMANHLDRLSWPANNGQHSSSNDETTGNEPGRRKRPPETAEQSVPVSKPRGAYLPRKKANAKKPRIRIRSFITVAASSADFWWIIVVVAVIIAASVFIS